MDWPEQTDLSSLVKVEPVLSVVFNHGMGEAGVVLVVEDGEVFQKVCDDDVEEDEGDENVVGDEPDDCSHHVTAVAIQLRTVVLASLQMEESTIVNLAAAAKRRFFKQ